MEKFASVLCVLVINAAFPGSAGAARAETLAVGLTIVPANSVSRPNSVARKLNRINGTIRIIEYSSPNYAASRQKLQQRGASQSGRPRHVGDPAGAPSIMR